MYLPENLSEIKKYRPAALFTGTLWYVEYYVYDPISKKLVRKKIKLNHIKSVAERRKYAYELIRKLNIELERGWNPFLQDQNSRSYSLLSSAIDDFVKINRKKYAEGNIREQTIQAYVSKMKILKDYMEIKNLMGVYVYNFNKGFIHKFLDYIYEERNRGSRTRDNYLKAIRHFSNYLVDREYLKVNPANDIAVLGKSKRGIKNRSVISDDVRSRLSKFLHEHNKHFLLASEILYYCMIRPKEMTFIKLKHIDLVKGTIFVPGETAKNYKDAVVTITEALTSLISELGIMEYPDDYYLFSDGFKPGKKQRRQKQFEDYWSRVIRPALGLTLDIKMYSLKDTGITSMIRHHNDLILVRDQARHHDLSVTNLYTPADMMQANEQIRKDDRKF